MEAHPEFSELLELFNERGVEYLIAGAHALAHLGVSRYTGDLDILIHPSPENAARVMECLGDFGFGDVGLSENDFARGDTIVQLGYPPYRVDILTSLTGVSWDDAWQTRDRGKFGNVNVCYIGRDAFVANKRATGRKQDLADLEALGEE